MKDHFKCGVTGCEHTRSARFNEFWAFKSDAGHMYDHYKWEHFELVTRLKSGIAGTVTEAYDYLPIPENVAPTFHTEDGDSYTWKEVQEHIR